MGRNWGNNGGKRGGSQGLGWIANHCKPASTFSETTGTLSLALGRMHGSLHAHMLVEGKLQSYSCRSLGRWNDKRLKPPN
eukprot:3804927-Amphidinium_carterae.1